MHTHIDNKIQSRGTTWTGGAQGREVESVGVEGMVRSRVEEEEGGKKYAGFSQILRRVAGGAWLQVTCRPQLLVLRTLTSHIGFQSEMVTTWASRRWDDVVATPSLLPI